MRHNVMEQAEFYDAPTWGEEVCVALAPTVDEMAKKKSVAPKARMSRPKGEDRNKPIIVTLRGTPEFKEFIERYAKRDRLSVADFVERAIVRYAKELGAEEEIPER